MSHKDKNKIIGFLVLICIVGFGWGFYQTSNSHSAINIVENDSQRAFNELLGNVENLDALTSKVMITNSTEQMSQLFSDINTKAYVAQENLSQLPINHSAFTRTEKFINQLGDFSYSLMKSTLNGKAPTEKQIKTMENLNSEMANISISLHDLATSEENPLSWQEMQGSLKNATMKNPKMGVADSSFNQINDNLVQVPTLIYDGPFSDHMESKPPIVLPGKTISWIDAKSLALKYYNDPNGKKYKASEYEISGKQATIPVLTVKLKPITSKIKDDSDAIYIDISQKGGFPVLITAPKNVKENKLSIDEATKKGQEYIDSTPYKNMKPNYSMIDSNVLTINFVYTPSGTTIYPDIVKISVSMGNGNIIAMEAQKYLLNHKERTIAKGKISIKEARNNLRKGLTLLDEKPCIIPLVGGKEVAAYEFRVNDKQGKEFFVYLSQADGSEVNILEIIYTNGGVFTI